MTVRNERRRRFLAFFEQRYRGDRQKLITDSGLTKGRVAQMFDKGQPFGEAAARGLALRLHLDEDFFERDDGLSAETLEWAQRYERMDEGERQRWRLLYQVARTGHSASDIKPATGHVPSAPGTTEGDSGLGELDKLSQPKKKR